MRERFISTKNSNSNLIPQPVATSTRLFHFLLGVDRANLEYGLAQFFHHGSKPKEHSDEVGSYEYLSPLKNYFLKEFVFLLQTHRYLGTVDKQKHNEHKLLRLHS